MAKSDTVDPALAEAIAKVEKSPGDSASWDALEELADAEQAPDPVFAAYKDALERGLNKKTAPAVADRAVKFCQAWYIDTPEAMPELLAIIVSKYPALEWAFERLVVLYTSAARWSDLLALYDKALSTTRSEKKRLKLLTEASDLAKDFADQPDRAADYLQQLLRLDPDNEKHAQALERLLERQKRWDELLSLWADQIPRLSTEEARDTRARIAEISLTKLGAPERALEQLRELVEENPGHEAACLLLETILGSEEAPAEVRRQALSLLRKTYEIVERPEDVVRVLTAALDFVSGADAVSLRREAATRLSNLGKTEEAMGALSALLASEPGDVAARRELRVLAKRSDRPDVFADALLAAAEAAAEPAEQVGLWLEAAAVKHKGQDDVDGAIALYQRALASDGADATDALRAAKRLDELLAGAERDADRLIVLEKLSQLERSPAFRRQVLGEAARLAERLDDKERALSAWADIIEENPADAEALDASIELFVADERWAEAATRLKARAASAITPAARRADLVRVARILASRLDDREGAIETWQQIRQTAGEDSEVVGELDQLLTASERWDALDEVLGSAVSRELGDTAGRLVRLADVKRGPLADPAAAAELYRQALVLDPANTAARAGAAALLDGPAAKTAATALWHAYDTTGAHAEMLALVPARAAAEMDSKKRAQIFADAAALAESGDDPKAAVGLAARAVGLVPERPDLRSTMLRLAAANDSWETALSALAEAADALVGEDEAAADVRRRQAEIAEDKLEDWSRALEARQAASELDPNNIVALGHVARCAVRAGRFDAAGAAAVAYTAKLGRVDERLLAWLTAGEDHASMAGALMDAVDAGKGLPPALASELYGHACTWFREHDDTANATLAARRAVDLSPEDATAIRRLVALSRETSGPELADTLLLADRVGDERSLDALREAADIAADDNARAIAVLERLYKKAADLWRSGAEHTGEHAPDTTAVWAVEALAERLIEGGERERAARYLLSGGELPLSPPKRAELNRRAAEQLVELNKTLPAIEAYRRVLADQQGDLDTIQRLAELSEREEAKTGSVALRERELELTDDVDTRLTMRLAMSRRAADLEARSGRVNSLLNNLAERPGHEASVQALSAILDERGHHDKLTEVLETQAQAIASEPQAAAALWARAAELAERRLRAPDRAIAAHRQVVELTQASRSMDALARLHQDKGEPGEAAKWLSMRLESADAADRVPVLLKLARTQQMAGRDGDATNTLKVAFAEAPENRDVRKSLMPLLRQREDFRALAEALTTGVEHAGDDATVLAYAREAADIYYGRLDEPGKAVPVLRRAVELAPDDKDLRRMLGDGLRDGGELDEAKTLLTDLVASYGRRGSRERAEAHLALAKVLHAAEEHEPALEQLDTASKMDADNVAILRTLAEQARGIGQLERAEAALRTLLLTARRLQASPSSNEHKEVIGTSEVLFELSSIARERGQADQAEELAESAIEALEDNDARAPQLVQKLKDRGENELLLRLLDARLEYVHSPYQRGAILGDKAAVLEAMGQASEAFDTRVEATTSDPGSPLLHDGMREQAVALDQLDRYVAHLQELLQRSRRDTDAMIRCELLLRLGEVHERETEDFEAASRMYDEAEATGVREVDVLRARARVAGARGDDDEQMRILEELASLGEDQVETRADALYRIAEVQLAAEETVDQGLATLRNALADHHRPARACKVLRRATDLHEEHTGLLDAYETVARSAGDDDVLLHYLERRAAHASATTDQVREAVNKAREIGQADRAEALMMRAVELAGDSDSDLYALDWALLGLAEVAKDRGDVDAAVGWLSKAADVADADSLFALTREVATLAGDGGHADPDVAASLYEKLRERDPSAREAWEPLVEIYRQQGNVDALERVVRDTLDGLVDVSDRNTLRVGLAGALMNDPERTEDAIGVLRDALFDEPGHGGALSLLTTCLENAGRQDELIELLRDQLIGAQDRSDAAAAKATALRLGPMLEPDEATTVYRDALALGDDVELLEKVIAALDDDEPYERAALGERLLALREGDDAAALALELAANYLEQDDVPGRQRVLELGLTRAPDNAAVREQLESHYREQNDAGGLARILETTALATEDPARKVALLCEAADVYARELGDAAHAVNLLTTAREHSPDDPAIAASMATCMTMSGEAAQAAEMLTEAMETADEDALLSLLVARAEARRAADDLDGAVEDLENAYERGPEVAAESLLGALSDLQSQASTNNDTDAEREAMMRAIDVLLQIDSRDRAIGMLAEWTARVTDDVDALVQLRDLEHADGRWEDLARTTSQLIDWETGDAQIASASLLLEAYVQLGAPDHAREAIERVWAAQPDSALIRAEVRRLYELIGENRGLAKLLIEEAGTLDDDEERVAHLRWAGEALLSVGDVEAAIPALTQVLDLVPNDAQARCLLADADVMMGRFPEAHALLDEAISTSKRSSPNLYMFHHRKAYVFHAEGDHAGQLESLKKAHQHARKNGQIAAELADLAEALEQWDLAVSTLRTITTIDEGCPVTPADALVRQGRIALHLGDDKRARLCARRAAMTDAEAESVKAFLAELGE